MIATIRGKILQKNPPQVVIECGGLGYEIDVPMSTFYNLPNIGEEVFLETVMIVREDAQLLYGFLTSQEKSVFRQLLKVSGIGPRISSRIPSGVSPRSSIIVTESISAIRFSSFSMISSLVNGIS